MYEFSIPMPFSKEFIDRVVFINNNVEKSKITSLYFSLPANSSDFTGFEQGRYCMKSEMGFEYWKPLIEYSMEKGFNFIYLLNSPRVYNPEFEEVDEHLKKLDKLINNLKSVGCSKLRVCSPQLMEYVNQNYPEMELYVSTSTELQSIKQYSNLFLMFNNIKEFVPAYDLNKNFMFLKNIRQKFPNIKIELMVNESCISGCPIKFCHNIFSGNSKFSYQPNYYFSNDLFINKCQKIFHSDLMLWTCNSNIIFPWEVEEYSKIGINKFKLIGRNGGNFLNGEILADYYWYIKGVDDYKNIENRPIRHFIHESVLDILVKDIKDYLPSIEYFKKYGHLCSTRCGTECDYCKQCAENIKDKIKEKYPEIK